MRNPRAEDDPAGAMPAGGGYWFTPMPVYLVESTFDPASPINAPAAMLWAHIHRHYAWRRRVFPSYATLAEETGQSESAVKRQMTALRQAGAITWGATYGPKGRSSNEYALAPIRAFDFDRATAPAVKVRSDLHQPVEVKNDLGVEVKSDPHPQVKNDLGVKSTEEVRASLSPRLPKQPAKRPPAAKGEREKISSDPDATAVTTAYVTAIGRPVSPTVAAKLTAQAAALLAAGFPAWWLTERATELAAHGWTDLAQHCDRSTAPTVRKPAETKADWCGTCQSPNNRLRKDPARDFELVECDTCHPAAVARRRRSQSGAAA